MKVVLFFSENNIIYIYMYSSEMFRYHLSIESMNSIWHLGYCPRTIRETLNATNSEGEVKWMQMERDPAASHQVSQGWELRHISLVSVIACIEKIEP